MNYYFKTALTLMTYQLAKAWCGDILARRSKDGFNPKTGEQTTALRRTLAIDDNLPIYDEYREMIGGMLG